MRWNRTIDWDDPDPISGGSTFVYNVKALIRNDGQRVILRDYACSLELNGIKFIGPSEKEDRTLDPFALHELTGAPAPPRDPYSHRMRDRVPYFHVGTIFDFIIEDENLYAAWFGQTDQWVMISLDDFKQTIVRDRSRIDRLNPAARQRALEIVLQHQPPPLRRAINALREQVAKIAPSLATQTRRRGLDEKTTAAYLFLSTLKNPADRAYIQHLLNFPARHIQQGHIMGDEGLELFFSVTHAERLVGDFLMRRWNGDTNGSEYLPTPQYLRVAHDTLKYLGSVTIDFVLPIDLPAQPGILWLYLIPAGVSPGDWPDSEKVTAFNSHLAYPFPRPEQRRPGRGKAVIRGIIPGEYRLKLVWERHPPATFWCTNVYTAAPGDYESAESAAFEVKPGETFKGITLPCTNRTGSILAYKEDDEAAKAENPGFEER